MDNDTEKLSYLCVALKKTLLLLALNTLPSPTCQESRFAIVSIAVAPRTAVGMIFKSSNLRSRDLAELCARLVRSCSPLPM